ncbi:MAG: hypothetical protein HYY06_18570 [Deltaproteobacteria bacterium]|nr:hypothetical protein [Deltaproteobacteria bacterium]
MRHEMVPLAVVAVMGCSGASLDVPGEEDAAAAEPRNVFELFGDGPTLMLEGSPVDPSYVAEYPNPDEVGYMKVYVQPSGLLDARCLVGPDELPCLETPFVTQVRERPDGSRSVSVWDVRGELIAALRFDAPPKGQPELPPALEELGPDESAEQLPSDADGEGAEPCGSSVLQQRLCDGVNQRLAEEDTGFEMDCDALTTPPGSRLGTERMDGSLETFLRFCASFVEEAYLPLVRECPSSAIDLVNWGMSARMELIYEGVCQHSPLVLDLDGDGVQATSLAQGASFDLLAVGEPVECAWVRGDDALLAHDVNRNGRVDDGSELFGQATGEAMFADGFAALRHFDGNSDGSIDSADPIYHEILLWNDLGGDGASQPSELRGLQEAGIRSLDLSPRAVEGAAALDVHGNTIPLQGTFERLDGTRSSLVDVFFRFRP